MLRQRSIRIGQFHPADRLLAERHRQPDQLPPEPGVAGRLRYEQLELLTGRRFGAREFQFDPGHGSRWRRSLEAGEEQPLHGLRIGRGLRESLLHLDP